jgi:hypothetical protein
MERPGADFRPLIAALEAASADSSATLSDQLATLELALVAAELNPDSESFIELTYALKALAEIDANARAQARGTAALGVFFEG